MKKFLFIIAVLLSTVCSKAQVTLEHTYLTSATAIGGEFFITNLGNNNYKYVVHDYDSSRFSLFNLDHTPFLLNVSTVISSNATNSIYYRLGYITSTLFDCDSTNIEFAMMLNSPNPTAHPNFAIYRTDGSTIFSKDTVGTAFCVGCGSGSWEMHPVMNTPAGAKLYLFNYNIQDVQQNFVYSLCGEMPVNITEIHQFNSFVKVFPNPTSHVINFEINAPSNFEEYELSIFNSAFQSIKTNSFRGANSKISLDDQSLSSGTYFYSLQNKSKVVQTGKFVFVK